MVPVVGLPPGTPLTLQETLVLLVPVTVAAKVCALPKSNEAVVGVMVAEMEEGGRGGGGGSCVEHFASVAARPPWRTAGNAGRGRNRQDPKASTRGCPGFCSGALRRGTD